MTNGQQFQPWRALAWMADETIHLVHLPDFRENHPSNEPQRKPEFSGCFDILWPYFSGETLWFWDDKNPWSTSSLVCPNAFYFASAGPAAKIWKRRGSHDSFATGTSPPVSCRSHANPMPRGTAHDPLQRPLSLAPPAFVLKDRQAETRCGCYPKSLSPKKGWAQDTKCWQWWYSTTFPAKQGEFAWFCKTFNHKGQVRVGF